MALIKCSECNKEISSEALSCPHCGYNLINEKYEVAFGSKCIMFLIPIIGYIVYSVNLGKNDKLAKSAIISSLFGTIIITIISVIIVLTSISMNEPKEIKGKSQVRQTQANGW